MSIVASLPGWLCLEELLLLLLLTAQPTANGSSKENTSIDKAENPDGVEETLGTKLSPCSCRPGPPVLSQG